jgi:UDP-N-acetylglucosamine diphosphorylase/glucosamine-1-phosphate N-acetyltransferase
MISTPNSAQSTPTGHAKTEPCAVVLAAGKGTRMKSDLPKVLCRVVDRPMIHFVLDALAESGVKQQIVVVGYQADLVRQELSSRSPSPQFALQSEQLGTGHAVMMCRKLLKNQTGPTIVLAGDSPLVQPDSLRELFDYFYKHRPSLLLGTLKKDDPTGLGRIVRNDAGEFIGIVEHKDATEAQRQIREVNMSTYLFDTADLLATLDSLDSNNSQNEYYLTDCASLLRKAGKKVEALPVLRECESMSINNPEELNQVDQAMRAMGYA